MRANTGQRCASRPVQQAIAQVLTPIFDPTISDSSFRFRPRRNAHQAIRQVQATVTDGYRKRGGHRGSHLRPDPVAFRDPVAFVTLWLSRSTQFLNRVVWLSMRGMIHQTMMAKPTSQPDMKRN